MKRREFLHIIGATGAAAAVGGCARGGGPDNVTPYLVPADDGVLPGVDAEYATVCRECPAGCGMIAKVRDGRVHKVEGNPDHPINRGKLCIRGHAALQGLYNPDRIAGPLERNEQTGRLQSVLWHHAQAVMQNALAAGGRVAWVGRLETGAFSTLVDRWLAAVSPSHIRLQYEPFAYEPLRAAHEMVFEQPGVPHFRIDQARMLLSFGADFLETWISNVEYTRQFSAWRQARVEGKRRRGRYVFIAPRLSLTGQNADEWVAIQPGTEGAVARGIELVVDAIQRKIPLPVDKITPLAAAAGIKVETVERLGREFAGSGHALALPPGNAATGPDATAACEAVLRLNMATGGAGDTMVFGSPHALSSTATHREMMDLIAEMQAGKISILFLHGVNPAYNLPPSSGWADAVAKVPHVISFASYPDETTGAPGETGGAAHLVLPDRTPLESWGEYSPRPGITGFQQPVVTPVAWSEDGQMHQFDTRPTGDLLLASAAAMGRYLGAATFQEYLRHSQGMDEAGWMDALQLGVVSPPVGRVRKGWSPPPQAGSDNGTATAGVPGSYATVLAANPTGTDVPIPSPASIGLATTNFSEDGLSSGAFATHSIIHVSAPPPRPAGTDSASYTMTSAPLVIPPPAATPPPPAGQLSLHIYPSLQFFDGRMADRSWMQEIPDATSKAVWGSWVELHPETAKKLGAQQGTLLALSTDYGRLEVPALISQNVHPDTLAIQMGQGHPLMGRSAQGMDRVNPITLLGASLEPASGAMLMSGTTVKAQAVATTRPLVVLQTSQSDHSTRNERSGGIAQSVELAELEAGKATGRPEEKQPSLYQTQPPRQHEGTKHHWGMVIDLDRCVGCNACVAACYSENNVPVVGKDQCANGREMAWLRIETYTDPVPAPTSDPAASELDIRFLPMLCQQCDNAPCEYVCPVNATVHSDEHLNMQVYNRCVGTRYCSNNCPYKVRRFNWFTFQFPPPLNQQLNPDVLHRKKGVMEKCTFCIQRIRGAEIMAGNEKRPIQDGEIQTACMQSCPADAIIFGDLEDKTSYVRQHSTRQQRGYGALGDLNTYPNITYLERVRVKAEG